MANPNYISLLFLTGVFLWVEGTKAVCTTNIQQQLKVMSTLMTVNQSIAFLKTQNIHGQMAKLVALPVSLDAMRVLAQLDVEIQHELAHGVKKWKEMFNLLDRRCQLAIQTELLLKQIINNEATNSGMIGEFRRQEDVLFDELRKAFGKAVFNSTCDFDSQQLSHFQNRLQHRSVKLASIFSTILLGSNENSTTLGEKEQVDLKQADFFLSVPQRDHLRKKFVFGDELFFDSDVPTNGGFVLISMPERPELWHLYFRSIQNGDIPLNFMQEREKCHYEYSDQYGVKGEFNNCKLVISDSPALLKIELDANREHSMMIMTDQCYIVRGYVSYVISREYTKNYAEERKWVSNLRLMLRDIQGD